VIKRPMGNFPLQNFWARTAPFRILSRTASDVTLQTEEESFWTERYDVKTTWSNQSFSDAYTAHDLLGNYTEEKSDIFESADHVALFSGSVASYEHLIRDMRLNYIL